MEISRCIGIIFGLHSGIFPRSREKVKNGIEILTCIYLALQNICRLTVGQEAIQYPWRNYDFMSILGVGPHILEVGHAALSTLFYQSCLMNFKLLDPYLNINKILQMMYHLNLLWMLNLATILFVGISCQKLYKIDLQMLHIRLQCYFLYKLLETAPHLHSINLTPNLLFVNPHIMYTIVKLIKCTFRWQFCLTSSINSF